MGRLVSRGWIDTFSLSIPSAQNRIAFPALRY
jgi:hypothetical protein